MKTLAALFAAAFIFAPCANAIPYPGDVVCPSLDANPSTDTLWLLIAHQVRDGASPGEAAKIIVNTISFRCPKHMAEVNQFVDEYGRAFGPTSLK